MNVKLCVATLLLPPTLAAAQTADPCPKPLGGRPSKATIRSIEARIECLQNTTQSQASLLRLLSVLGQSALSLVDDAEIARAAEATNQEARDLEEKSTKQEVFNEFANGNWSLAFGGIDRGSHITAAELDPNGLVKVTGTGDHDIRPVVAFTPSLWANNSVDDYDTGEYNDRFGLGPMVVANPGFLDPDGDSPWLVGVGLMLAVRTDNRGSSLGIGFAYALEQLKMLREDFTPNELAPLDAMGSRLEPVFEDRTTSSWMFVVSFSIGNPNS